MSKYHSNKNTDNDHIFESLHDARYFSPCINLFNSHNNPMK